MAPRELREREGYGCGNQGRRMNKVQDLGERERYGLGSGGEGGTWPWEPSPALVPALPPAPALQPGKGGLAGQGQFQGYFSPSKTAASPQNSPLSQLPLPYRARPTLLQAPRTSQTRTRPTSQALAPARLQHTQQREASLRAFLSHHRAPWEQALVVPLPASRFQP